MPEKKTLIITGYTDLEDLHKAAKDNIKVATDTSNSQKYSAEVAKNRVQDVAIKANCTPEIAYQGICGVLNQEGISPWAQKTIYVKIGSTKITLEMVTQSLKNLEGPNATTRKLARTLGIKIQEICSEIGINGNLAKKLLQYDPTLTQLEQYWCADFQDTNPDCLPTKSKTFVK